MTNVDTIITEAINEQVDGLITEGVIDSIKKLIKSFYEEHPKKNKEEKKREKKERKKAAKEKKGKKKVRKKVGGAEEFYDYDDYERKNKKISASDADSIRNTVDQENTDIAAVARKLLPHHTKTGSQSQVRKVLNGERPMTKTMASKLSKMISSGEVAVK